MGLLIFLLLFGNSTLQNVMFYCSKTYSCLTAPFRQTSWRIYYFWFPFDTFWHYFLILFGIGFRLVPWSIFYAKLIPKAYLFPSLLASVFGLVTWTIVWQVSTHILDPFGFHSRGVLGVPLAHFDIPLTPSWSLLVLILVQSWHPILSLSRPTMPNTCSKPKIPSSQELYLFKASCGFHGRRMFLGMVLICMNNCERSHVLLKVRRGSWHNHTMQIRIHACMNSV